MDKRRIECLCGTSHDITFCTSRLCSAKDICERNIKKHVFNGEQISVADFFNPKQKCKEYIKGA